MTIDQFRALLDGLPGDTTVLFLSEGGEKADVERATYEAPLTGDDGPGVLWLVES